MNCLCVESFDSKAIECSCCLTTQHVSCMGESIMLKKYECPQCQLKLMDPYIDVCENILTPTLLIMNSKKKSVEASKHFVLTNSQISAIKEYQSSEISESPLFITIRCLKLDSTGYEHHWPLNGSLTVNGVKLKDFKIPKFPPRAKPRQDFPIYYHFRQDDLKLNVNKLPDDCYRDYKELITSNNVNRISLINNYSANDNDKSNYVLSIDLVRVRTSKQIISDIEKIESIPRLQHLRGVNNNDIQICEERLNLNDVMLTSQVINYPARSINCHHLTVFDLEIFLQTAIKNKKFNCPICKEKSVKMYIDKQVERIIHENTHETEVILNSNYEVVKPNQKASSKPQKSETDSGIFKPNLKEANIKNMDSHVVDLIDLDEEILVPNKNNHKADLSGKLNQSRVIPTDSSLKQNNPKSMLKKGLFNVSKGVSDTTKPNESHSNQFQLHEPYSTNENNLLNSFLKKKRTFDTKDPATKINTLYRDLFINFNMFEPSMLLQNKNGLIFQIEKLLRI